MCVHVRRSALGTDVHTHVLTHASKAARAEGHLEDVIEAELALLAEGDGVVVRGDGGAWLEMFCRFSCVEGSQPDVCSGGHAG